MAIRYPLEYGITPKTLSSGRRWVVVDLRNVGAKPLAALDVRLNSEDAYSFRVLRESNFVPALDPGEERLLPFQVIAVSTTQSYLSADGWEELEVFHWETPAFTLAVDDEVAELLSFFVLTQPYLSSRETVKCEATLKGLTSTSGLGLEFWADAPNGAFVQLGDVDVKPLVKGETVRYTIEFTPAEEGLYTVYAYLYDDMRRVGRETDTVYVSPS